MQRRKPFSAKKKKAQLQQKRAVKRGDISPPPPTARPERHGKGRRGPATGTSADPSPRIAAADSSRRLQSSFVKLPPEFLQDTKSLASTIPLQRPIPPDAAILNPAVFSPHADSGLDKTLREQLTCPKRPKWRYDMSKKEVEKNEEALFHKWLEHTDQITNKAYDTELVETNPGASRDDHPVLKMPHAPTSYERNLEVWRQLWRVTEIAQIILILLDSRCPILHYPPSLSAYLSSANLPNRTRSILVLTKVDIAGHARADAWTQYLNSTCPGLKVVQVEAYISKDAGVGSGKRKLYEPHIPTAFRQSLVEALKEAHADLLLPPARLRDQPEKLKNWKPRVKREVDWTGVLNASGGQVGTIIGGALDPKGNDEQSESVDGQDVEDDNEETWKEPEFLTVGLIGQPNVGKSSLLNALFGVPKVKASRTPGKTKHFQTLFWTPDVRLVDCPGLVMPNITPMETQVLSGILPISRVSAVPLCIHYAAQLLPLEEIYELRHPALAAETAPDKRTWRQPRTETEDTKGKKPVWTAMDILTAFALKKGWVTAKAGRPDINRAGNYILRALAEGKVHWAFWPPSVPQATVQSHQAGRGIWIPFTDEDHEDDELSDEDSDVDRPAMPGSSDEDEDTPEDAESEEEGFSKSKWTSGGGRFGALLIDDE